ncbi:sensor histidine kinase [Clostridium akagii]|uniref:sensor histidine kinase n=1 Tax=Clostridium akagii TaxID=91623 RepID=UPI00047A7E0C|nr:HAMP domain-containing sensor histidine kinase [Clostridium akagii]
MDVKRLENFSNLAKRLDISSIKKQAENFNLNEPYLKAFDSLNIFIIILNSCRQVVYANKTYLKLININSISQILGKTLGETLSCIHAFKNQCGCGTASACKNCSADNIVLKSIIVNEEFEDEISIIRKIDGFDTPLNLFEKVAPIEINDEIFHLVSFIDATDSVIRRTMEKIFFHDVINTAGALKGILNLLKDEIPSTYENQIIQVEGLFEGLIDEIQSQKQILAAENNELFIAMEDFNSKEVLITLKKLYKGYSNSINKIINIDEDSISINMKNDITLLKRVVGNMIKNALEATDINGVVTIGCNEISNGSLKYWVKNGSYISEEVQKNIFKRAFSTKANIRGLGTYSMKLLGEKYLKGDVGFTSNKNEGTCFYIEIPKEKYK